MSNHYFTERVRENRPQARQIKFEKCKGTEILGNDPPQFYCFPPPPPPPPPPTQFYCFSSSSSILLFFLLFLLFHNSIVFPPPPFPQFYCFPSNSSSMFLARNMNCYLKKVLNFPFKAYFMFFTCELHFKSISNWRNYNTNMVRVYHKKTEPKSIFL